MNSKKRIKSFVCLFVLSILYCVPMLGQEINGIVMAKERGNPVSGAYVTLFSGDSIVAMAQTDAAGKFLLECKSAGDGVVVVSALGYLDTEKALERDTASSVVRIYLEEDIRNVNLHEVVVESDTGERVTRTANGEVFRLSRQAKSMKNPFRALREIPLLIADDATSTITMLNGDAPLILIDGNRINSGVAPLNPSEIESVEVINVVPARYLQEGYSGIVNIRLKRIYRNYLWLEGATRHEVPVGKGFGVFYFEVGNRKYSLYGRASYEYERHTDTENSVVRSNTGYSQAFNFSDHTDGHKWLGELLYKWSITPKDYMAAHFYINDRRSDMTENGLGDYTEASTVEYVFSGGNVNRSRIITSSLYYKHSFKENNEIEMRAAYNHNGNDLNSSRTDYWGDRSQQFYSIFHNLRNSGNIDIDYSNSSGKGASLSLGSHTTMQYDRITQTSSGMPTFKHGKWNEYIYGSYSRWADKFSYMLTAGLEMIWLTAGDADNNYIRPRASLSGTCSVDSHNSIQLAYTLSNTAPGISELNPYNTSTDSMIVTSGNPFLTPEMSHYLRLKYTLNYGKLYVSPSVGYYRAFDVIESDGYSENGVYHSTFANLGHFSQMLYGINLSQRFKRGRIYGGAVWNDCYYTGMSPKGFLSAYFGFSTKLNKFSFNGDLSFQNRSYSQYSTVSFGRPSMAQVQVTYNFTPDFYISLCLQDCTGEFYTRTTVNNGDYKSEVVTHFKNRSLRPWILLRYTFRKHVENKIKLGKVLDSVEEGINIKK